MEQHKTQFAHELRRRDAEHERLLRRLSGMLSSSSSSDGGSSSGGCARRRSGAASTPGRISMTVRRGSGSGLDAVAGNLTPSQQQQQQETELQRDNLALRRALQQLQAEHKALLNQTATQQAAAAPSSLAMATGHNSSSSRAGGAAPNPCSALLQLQERLEALRVRKQRIVGRAGRGAGTLAWLNEQQLQGQTPCERLLAAKLSEAARLLEEQDEVRGPTKRHSCCCCCCRWRHCCRISARTLYVFCYCCRYLLLLFLLLLHRLGHYLPCLLSLLRCTC
jgi:hypothetical protein